jgi:outer membrane protein
MKKELFFLFCFLSFLVPFKVYAQEYSLDDLYRIALERSETIKIAEENLYISEREKDKAAADLIPTLSAFGQHTRFSEEKRSSGFLLQPKHTNEWGLRLDQTFSLGGREFTALDISKQGVDQSRFNLHAVREQYLWDVSVQYYDVLKAKREIEIATANVQRLTKERDAAKKRLEVGTAIKTTVLRAEAELADAQSELIRTENVLKVAKNILARTVDIREDYDVREPLVGIDYQMPQQGKIDLSFLTGDCLMSTLDCLKEKALSERAEIKSLTVQRDITEDSLKLAKSAYWPDLSIEGVYFREENDPSPTFELDERMYGGLRLDFPFFEGGLKRAEVSKAKSRLRQAEYSLSDLKREVSVEVENSYIVATTAASILRPRQAEVEFARENYNLVSKQFQYGLADSIDVIDANTRLVTSERELLNARYVYVLSVLGLKRVTGILLTTVIGSQPSDVSGNMQ